MHTVTAPAALPSIGPAASLATGQGVIVVLPTYNEHDNLESMAAAVLGALPAAHLLVVDDDSPDGTGALADRLAAREPRVTVLHRSGKQGLGAAYDHAFQVVLGRPDVDVVVQMDADFSHDPRELPRLLEPLVNGADVALGTRYVEGGGTVGWPLHRRLISRAGTLFARALLRLPYHDLTGGFKAWRRAALEAVRLCDVSANGYGFQIETTWWAHRCGARIAQVPITFRDRTAGISKMSPDIAREAAWLVLRLRWHAIMAVLHPRRLGSSRSITS
jgi:dolichol-phosphate mannosyltransferase